jgi:predicted phosphate transport protein (TIGR00153 family)
MVLTRFLPQNEKFYEHFQDAATNALEVAQLLNETFTNRDDTERKVRRLHDLEHRGDEITHRVFSALNSTFVTPMDREDIAGLASELDEFVDMMEEVGARLWLYKLADTPEPARLLTRILIEQATLIETAMQGIADVGKARQTLKQQAVELHRLENEGDDSLNNALATLYDGVTEVPELIRALRWGELYGLLEDATDRAEDIGDRLEGIVAKYA